MMYERACKAAGLLGAMYLGDRYTASWSFELAKIVGGI